MPTIVITTVEQYEVATQEVQRLAGAADGTPEEQLRADLILAIEIWDAKHDDATGWKD